jgi:integrase
MVNDRRRIRLRWRFQSQRYPINLSFYAKTNLLQASKIALEIEQDMAIGRFYFTLLKYGGREDILKEDHKTMVVYFEEWVTNYKQMDCEKHINYYSVRSILRKWGDINPSNIHLKLNADTFNAY